MSFLQDVGIKANRLINIVKYGAADEHEAFTIWIKEGDTGIGGADKLLHRDDNGAIIVPAPEMEKYEADLRNLCLMRQIATVKHIDDVPANKEVIAGLCDLYGAVKLGEDELEDDSYNITEMLMDSLARSVAYMQDSAYFNGTGADMPRGILFTPGVPTVHNHKPGEITPDDLLSLVHELPPKYRTGAAFFINSSTELALRRMKDGKGQYLWQPNQRAGQPNTFLGYPVYTNESINTMPEKPGETFIVGAFGNPSCFVIEDTRKLTITSLYSEDEDEKAKALEEQGLVGFKIHTKVNGKLKDTKAFVTLTVTA